MKVRTGNNQDPTTLWKHLEEIIKTHIRPLLQDHGGDIVIREIRKKDVRVAPVSYTHLTLPTNREV